MIGDAVLAGLLSEQLLETRLSEVTETAISTYLSALDNDEQATARLFIQKAAQAADESWQHTVSGQQGPGVAGRPLLPWDILAPPLRMKTAMTWTSQYTARAVLVGHSSERSFRDSLTGHVSDARSLKGCLAASHKNRRPVSCSSLPQMSFLPGRLRATGSLGG